MPMFNTLTVYLFVAVFLLCAGILGLVYRRTLIGMLISVELIMNGAGLNLVAINRFLVPESGSGMIFTLFIMGIAAAEVAIALAIIVLIFKRVGVIQSGSMKEMKD